MLTSIKSVVELTLHSLGRSGVVFTFSWLDLLPDVVRTQAVTFTSVAENRGQLISTDGHIAMEAMKQ